MVKAVALKTSSLILQVQEAEVGGEPKSPQLNDYKLYLENEDDSD